MEEGRSDTVWIERILSAEQALLKKMAASFAWKMKEQNSVS